MFKTQNNIFRPLLPAMTRNGNQIDELLFFLAHVVILPTIDPVKLVKNSKTKKYPRMFSFIALLSYQVGY